MQIFKKSEKFELPNQAEQILLHQLTEGPANLLLIGGVHGDEPEGFFLVEKFINTPELWLNLQGKANLWVIPRLNPWGAANNSRVNKNGVDLNRNMPTKDWVGKSPSPRYFPGPSEGSESETQILISIIEQLNPRLIVSAHSWNPMINYNGPCLKVAKHMSDVTKYILSDDIGYPTPGSLGTWAGWERKIPVITLEIERALSEEKIWATHALPLASTLVFASLHEKLD